MYRGGANVNEARKASVGQDFPDFARDSDSTTVIVSGKNFRKISGHSSQSFGQDYFKKQIKMGVFRDHI